MRSVASDVAALIFSYASLACVVPVSAIARNACGVSVIGELVGFEAAVWVVVAMMSLVSFGFGASLSGDFRTRRPKRLSEPLDHRERCQLVDAGILVGPAI